MKVVFTLCICFFIICSSSQKSYSQIDTTYMQERVLLFADSMVRTYMFNEWESYTKLTYPGYIKFLGGKQGFLEYSQRLWRHFNDSTGEELKSLKVLQIVANEGHWQCVVQKERIAYLNHKKANIISYLVGKSVDEGTSWTFFDVSDRAIDNATLIMPELSDELTLPQRKVVYEDDTAVKKQAIRKKKTTRRR